MFYVVCIVAIVLAANTVQQYLKLRHRKENKSAQAEETQAQLDALEERIRVLERIVTENRFDLRDEINKL
jgi:TolA-binding protein